MELKRDDLYLGELRLDSLSISTCTKTNYNLGGLPNNGVSETTAGLYSNGYSGCIHYFGVHNRHVSLINAGEESGKLKGYGGQVDFSNFHLNRDSEGIVSSERCLLEEDKGTTEEQVTTTTEDEETTTTKMVPTRRPTTSR
jgi:hypothetical protein